MIYLGKFSLSTAKECKPVRKIMCPNMNGHGTADAKVFLKELKSSAKRTQPCHSTMRKNSST